MFLNLDGIRGTNDGAVFDVYLTLPGTAAAQREQFVGVIAMFGVSQASKSEGSHAGNGLKKVLEITKVIDAQVAQLATAENFEVRFVPRGSDPARSDVTVDRVSIYRQGSGR
ncbi:hypothetical protein AJ87_07045 [Rhizobium yanglingense]|nr:hypothetical protein AJ87_07045 [Rhizobium yanglingense]